MTSGGEKWNGFFGWLRQSWPILTAIFTAGAFLVARTEVLSSKVKDLSTALEKMEERERAHTGEDGHKVMIERVKRIEDRLKKLEGGP